MRLPSTQTQIGIAIYALAYAGALIALATEPEFSIVEPLFALAVLGGAFPALAMLLSRRTETPRIAIGHPAREALAAIAYLALFAVIVLGFGFSALKAAIDEPRPQALAILATKLTTMVLAPLLIGRAFGHSFREQLALRLDRRAWLLLGVVGAAMLAFQAVFGRGLQTLGELAPSAGTLAWAGPACFALLTIEVGATEEFLYRVFLQTRLAAWLRSEPAAIFIGALLFGLSHAPGLYLRGGSLMEGVGAPTPGWAIAYSIAMTSTAGFVFGVLWWRTRSFGLIVLLHALMDLLPQLAPFLNTWAG